MNLNKIILSVAVATLAIAINGCGSSASGGGAGAGVSGLVGAVSPNATSINILKSIKLAHKEALIQKQVLAKYKSSKATLEEVCAAFEAQEDSLKVDAGCTLTCDDSDPTDMSISVACTDLTSTETCGSETYALENFNLTTTIGITMSGETPSFSLDMVMAGDVTSPNLTGAVDCTLGFEMNIEDSADVADFDCADTNFSCTAGGKTITCAELEAAAATSACQ